MTAHQIVALNFESVCGGSVKYRPRHSFLGAVKAGKERLCAGRQRAGRSLAVNLDLGGDGDIDGPVNQSVQAGVNDSCRASVEPNYDRRSRRVDQRQLFASTRPRSTERGESPTVTPFGASVQSFDCDRRHCA